MEAFNKSVQLHIGGMTCISCQHKIERELKHTVGVVSAAVSYNDGTADIVYDGRRLSLKKIAAIIERLDYEVLAEKDWQKPDFVRTVCLSVMIACLYAILQITGILNLLVPGRLAGANMGYGILFVIGLTTSVHCIAMCGGINLSQCIPNGGHQGAAHTGKPAKLIQAFAYNSGRVLSYTVIGFVLGLTGFLFGGGAGLGMSALLQGILKIIAGLLMVIMGVNMLELFPKLRRFTIRIPKRLIGRIGGKRKESSGPFIVGVLNGFMPCGPLQSMWIVALATGNPFAGALSMFLFSLGTVPLMLGFGSVVAILGKRFTDTVMTIGAVLVAALGLAMLAQGGSLSGLMPPDLLFVLVAALCLAGILLSIPVAKRRWSVLLRIAALTIVIGSYAVWSILETRSYGYSVTDSEPAVADSVQLVNSTLESGRYPNITVQAGIPVKWIIDAPEGSINGCNYKVIIQDYDMEYTFHTGENVIEFIPAETGTIYYSCWMGMIHGSIFVTDGAENQSLP